MKIHTHEHSHHHTHGWKSFITPAISMIMLITGALIPECIDRFRFEWYALAFIPVGLPVIREAIHSIFSGDYFNEFILMSLACFGAFYIGEYSEAVGVMLFYSIGEAMQHGAVDRATRNISRLIDSRNEKAMVVRDGALISVSPESIDVGEIIEVHPGQRALLDGLLLSKSALFDTSALTGESIPREIRQNDEVLAGMIPLQRNVRIKTTRRYTQSALAKIMSMVSEASSRKARTEIFIRRFAHIYTPIVFVLALLVVVLPALYGVVNHSFQYILTDWLYRALVLLVISCPCALVISIPLGYFAGIGAASRAGILFKGGNYLDAIAKIKSIAFDKTGTLTTGCFAVEAIECKAMNQLEMLAFMASAESASTHPLAKTLVKYVNKCGISIPTLDSATEEAGYGVHASVCGRNVVVGSTKLLSSMTITYPSYIDNLSKAIIVCAVDGQYIGYVALSDTIKSDAVEAISQLRTLGVENIAILSGDRQVFVNSVAETLNIDEAYGELLPQGKADFISRHNNIAFVGDGINDAPVLALSNVGIAMGGLGSDVAIESADVVIQTDSLSRVATAIKIGRSTRSIITQNIVGAITIKIAILALGAAGYASLWAAVFADVGVALLAVANSVRIMRKRY